MCNTSLLYLKKHFITKGAFNDVIYRPYSDLLVFHLCLFYDVEVTSTVTVVLQVFMKIDHFLQKFTFRDTDAVVSSHK